MKNRIGQTVGSFPTMMDNLESRVMLSGNVAVSVVSGNLVVRGDASANSIILNNAGRNRVRVSGADGTTIGGAAGPLTMSGVHGLSLKMGDGNDNLRLDDLTFDRAVLIDMGAGDDVAQIEKHGTNSGPPSLFKASTAIKMGAGSDLLQVGSKLGNRAVFSAKLVLNGGTQGDTLFYPRASVLPTGAVSGFESINPKASGINLRSAGIYGILAGAGVSNTGGTTINGNLGTSPTGTVVGSPTVNGVIHSADPLAAQAKLDLTIAYNEAKGRAGTPTKVLPGELSGLRLAPGIYKNSSSVKLSSSPLTLDAQGNPNAVFIFQIGTTLTTLSSTQVILAGGAKASNIFWQVGSSATLGTTSSFKGNIMADQSITLTHLATLEGRALARIGAVTLDSNTVTVPA